MVKYIAQFVYNLYKNLIFQVKFYVCLDSSKKISQNLSFFFFFFLFSDLIATNFYPLF